MKSLFQIEVFKAVWGAKAVATPNGEAVFEQVMLDSEVSYDLIEDIAENKYDIVDIEKWISTSFVKDSSKTNASSIVICLSFYDKKLLFTGDSCAEDLLKALGNWQKQNDENYHFDVIKLPHHCSINNCFKMLDKIDGTYYLVSTDGKKFEHSSKETIAKIVVRSTENKRYILFNYKNRMYELCNDQLAEEKYNYEVRYQTGTLEI